MPTIDSSKVHDPRLNYLGSSISSITVDWNNWLASGAPDAQDGLIYFLRGSISPNAQGQYPPYIRTTNPVTVCDNQAIFFPIMASTAWTGGFPGLTTDGQLLADVRADILQPANASSLYAMNLDNNDNDSAPIIDSSDIGTLLYAESPPFTLNVPPQNAYQPTLWDTITLTEGSSAARSAGYWLLILPLVASPQPYRLRFGGRGRVPYTTEAKYHIFVRPAMQILDSRNETLIDSQIHRSYKTDEIKSRWDEMKKIKDEMKKIKDEMKKIKESKP